MTLFGSIVMKSFLKKPLLCAVVKWGVILFRIVCVVESSSKIIILKKDVCGVSFVRVLIIYRPIFILKEKKKEDSERKKKKIRVPI